MKQKFLGAVALAALCIASTAVKAAPLGGVFADDIFTDATDMMSDLMDTVIPGVTNVRIGLGPVMSTDYQGGNHYEVKAAPLISLRYKDILQVDNNQIRVNLFGESGALWESSHFRAGPLLKVDFGRSESDSSDLTGMGDIGTSFEVGGFASYTMGPLRYRLRARYDAASGHNGVLADIDVSLAVYRSATVSVGSRLGTTWASGKYMNTYFGLTAAQATATGLTAYTPGSGVKDIIWSIGSEMRVTPNWSVVVNGGYQRLLSKAKNSPIVSVRGSANQYSLGAYAVYSF